MTYAFAAIAAMQLAALAVLVVRLAPGYRRPRPVSPRPDGLSSTTVTAIVPSLNEARRIGPCLEGLVRQGAPLLEVLVVDSASTDGTREIVSQYAARDPRIRLVTDPPLPEGWIGKVWALQHGLSLAQGEWLLGVDADTEAESGMVAGVVSEALARDLDVVSFSPRFDGQSGAERWLQPSMLTTLIYRFGAPRELASPDRIMANGQCFLARRSVLERYDGYALAKGSFADDVMLARALARRGVRVAFLDGQRLYRVRAYESAGQMWREWGRSFDLADATSTSRQVLDVLLVCLTQGLPLPMLLANAVLQGGLTSSFGPLLLVTNATLFGIRVLLMLALAPSYVRRGLPYWLSPLSDPLAAVRLVLSSIRRPSTWRGRTYDHA